MSKFIIIEIVEESPTVAVVLFLFCVFLFITLAPSSKTADKTPAPAPAAALAQPARIDASNLPLPSNSFSNSEFQNFSAESTGTSNITNNRHTLPSSMPSVSPEVYSGEDTKNVASTAGATPDITTNATQKSNLQFSN